MALHSVDFLPNRTSKVLLSFEPFSTVIAHANQWLLTHSSIEIRCCETLDFRATQAYLPEIRKAAYKTDSDEANVFIRGLRLWYSPVNSPTDRPQKIAFFNIVPQFVEDENVAETMEEAVSRTNTAIQRNPIPGKVISIDSFDVKYEDVVHPDDSCWLNSCSEKQYFLSCLRVFYIVASPENELIGVQDFTPKTIRASRSANNYSLERPLVDSYPVVFKRLKEFVAQIPQTHRVLAVKTLRFRQNFMEKVDTSRTSFCEDNVHTYHLKFLRLSFVIKPEKTQGLVPPVLRNKLFVPVMKHPPGCFSMAKFETQQDTLDRLREWIASTGMKAVCAETLTMRVFSGAENFEGLQTMHTWNRIIHHSTAVHSHRHNFLHGKTHHRHGVQHRECTAMSETFLQMYRLYFVEVTPGSSIMQTREEMSKVEEYMLRNSECSCSIL